MDPAGFISRNAAAAVLHSVLARHHALDDALTQIGQQDPFRSMSLRDRAFTRVIVATVLRRLGQLDEVLGRFVTKPLPEKRGKLREILLSAAAQLLFLATPPHAAISLAVDQAKADGGARRFAGLANAVLRRVASEGPMVLAGQDAARLNTPEWLWQRWSANYGEERARAIAESHLAEAPLDLSFKTAAEAADWAGRLDGVVLPTGSVRVKAHGPIDAMPGFEDGAWWVQDAAAALPARLLGDVAGLRVADLCAAPGGKTACLAAAGARVTAVELAADRIDRMQQNLRRLHLEAEIVRADVTQWRPAALFDAVLLDAPCSATGTIRRHPDIPHLKRATDLIKLAETQHLLLASAMGLVRPGGRLIYCTCSLEPEEGLQRITSSLAEAPGWRLLPIEAGELGLEPGWITQEGCLRTLPCDRFREFPESGGIDGFFAARLIHSAE